MVQYWRLVCFDKRESTADLGEFGDLLLPCGEWIENKLIVRNPLGQTHSQGDAADDATSWRDSRIICVGDSGIGGCPEDMLSNEEREAIDDVNLYYVEDFRTLGNKSSGESDDGLPEPQEVEEDKAVAPRQVLRNKTLRVYVRRNAIPGHARGTSLGTLLLLQICWSHLPSMSLVSEFNGLEQGPWAGHRFDIVDEDNVDSSWTDVSQEVIDKLMPIIEAEVK